MAGALPLEFERRADSLCIHFDVHEHFLKLDTFIQTAVSARKIVDALDETFFQGRLEYDLIVLPPEDGSFLSKLALWIGGGVGAVFAFVNSDVGASYVEGLTGKPPTHWAKQFGETNSQHLQQLEELMEAEEVPNSLGGEPLPKPPPIVAKPENDEAACQYGARLVVALTRGVLEKGDIELRKIGMELGSLPNALDARAEFYEACIDDAEVRGIGFTPDDDFPIRRNSFPERAQKPSRKKDEDEVPEWVVAIESIYVNSPNWNEDKQNTRKWQGIDSIRHECLFVVEDAEFWGRIRKKELQFEGLDSLKVQWAYQIIDGRTKNRRVLRVMEFNDLKLAEPLPPEAISAILGTYSNVEAARGEASLFEYSEKKHDT